MGKKINPIAFRSVIKNVWFFSNKDERGLAVEEDYIIQNYLMKIFGGLVCSNIAISRIMKKIIITIQTIRVGVVIGKANANLEKVKAAISKLIAKPVIINVEELYKPELNASFIAYSVADVLVQRGNYLMAIKNFLKRAILGGVKGIRIELAGRIQGATIARRENFQTGRLSRQTIRENIDFCSAPALTRNGFVGVKTTIQL